MSVVVWDGNGLAADRQATSYDTRVQTQKVFMAHDGNVVAFTGSMGAGYELIEWYNNGRIVAEYPAIQKTDDWARLIVCSKDGCWSYEQSHIPMKVLDKYAAFGSGADFARGALAMGADAIRAVQVANQFNVYCGYGVDYFVPQDKQTLQ